MMKIDARGVYYRNLNKTIRDAVASGEKEFELININGQRYIGDGLQGSDVKIDIHGVPGNDMAAFMDGPTLIVHSNAQDDVSNTMNEGKVVIHGHAGDVLGYGMRGGKLFVKGDAGFRVGIHMKGYMDKVPVMIIGGTAGNFFGEYMAGGVLILLGINRKKDTPIAGDYLGTGMHGGVMYIRGEVDPYQCGAEVGVSELNVEDKKKLSALIKEYCDDLGFNYNEIMSEKFVKLYPKSSRPYGKLYAY